MINEVIGSILKAEERADKIKKDANAKAHENVFSAESRARDIRHGIKEEMKKKAAAEYAAAEKAGTDSAAKIIEAGKISADKIKEEGVKNMEEAADFIIRRLLKE